jgi:signal transduction histidine kinase
LPWFATSGQETLPESTDGWFIPKPTAKDPEAKSVLATIEVSAKRGADIVRQVLSFARGLEGDRLEIRPQGLLKDLESIIKDTFPRTLIYASTLRAPPG